MSGNRPVPGTRLLRALGFDKPVPPRDLSARPGFVHELPPPDESKCSRSTASRDSIHGKKQEEMAKETTRRVNGSLINRYREGSDDRAGNSILSRIDGSIDLLPPIGLSAREHLR